jgi:hypothetical protein
MLGAALHTLHSSGVADVCQAVEVVSAAVGFSVASCRNTLARDKPNMYLVHGSYCCSA